MNWHIGTIGFAYPDWVGVIFPPTARPATFLAEYAQKLRALELDTTFHAIPPIERVKKWVETVPEDFIFCVKTPKQITHETATQLDSAAMDHFLRSIEPMRQARKLGPILIQFPATFTVREFGHLERFLMNLPPDYRFAIEFRNAMWADPRTSSGRQTVEMLKHFRCCLVAADYAVDPDPIQLTTDFLYARFIGIHEQFPDDKSERIDMTDRLSWWQEEIVAASSEVPLREVFCFFSNHYAGCSPMSANRLRTIVGQPTVDFSQPEPPGDLFSIMD